jgi:nuclear transport factor 2 (NTF2) superfamily protein
MKHQDFDLWLTRYKGAWEARDPQAVALLFTEDAHYYETPFSAPLSNRADIYEYWSNIPRNQKNIHFTYQILAMENNVGIARWQTSLERMPSLKTVALDGILQATFDATGLCQLFEEWWHRLEEI